MIYQFDSKGRFILIVVRIVRKTNRVPLPNHLTLGAHLTGRLKIIFYGCRLLIGLRLLFVAENRIPVDKTLVYAKYARVFSSFVMFST